MSLLHAPIQRKLSALLGAEVTFERFNLSLLRGTLDVHGVAVAGGGGGDAGRAGAGAAGVPPVLTIARVRAEVALTKALAGEVVVKSLTIERPVFSFVRRADGTTNLPTPVTIDDAPDADDDAADNGARDGTSGEAEAPSKWRLSARKVLLVDGQAAVHLHARGAGAGDVARYSADRVLAELSQTDGGFDFTLMAESVGRRDGAGVELGQFRVVGKLAGPTDLSRVAEAGLVASAELGNAIRAAVESPRLAGGQVSVDLSGKIDLAALGPLLPNPAAVPVAAGTVDLAAAASFARQTGLRVSGLTLKCTDVRIPAFNPE